jgi:hypothetical protein
MTTPGGGGGGENGGGMVHGCFWREGRRLTREGCEDAEVMAEAVEMLLGGVVGENVDGVAAREAVGDTKVDVAVDGG